MEIRQIPVKDLREWERNPRKHDVDRLVKSIKAFGFRAPLVVNETPKGYVVEAGHGRLKAAKMLGMKTLPCVVVSDDEKTAMAYAIADNRQQELTEWQLPDLKDLLQELDDGWVNMEAIGYTEKELEDLMTQFNVPTEGLTDDDAVPDEAPPICKTGDLWLLGEHRLLCGDSTKAEDVARLMDGQKADVAVIDPPFECDDLVGFMDPCVVFGQAKHLFKIPQHLFRFERIIDKGVMHRSATVAVGHMHAFVFQCGSNKKLPDDGGTYPSIVKDEERKEHPYQKPVGLLMEHLTAWVSPWHLCYDPFLGSGSTLIACEKLGRKCYGMEIDPHYCDVIIKRWEEYTGKKATQSVVI